MKKFFRLLKSAIKGEEHDYTSGSIRKAIILLSIPMVLEMAMESLFALVDAYFVAQISPDAMATVGLTESVITLVYAIAIGISTAPVAMISRYIGQKDDQSASRVAKQAIYMAMGVSILLAIPGVIYADDILRFMGGSEQLIASGKNFTRILFGSNAVIMLLFLLNGIFRGAGDAAYAMRALWLANGINIILDPIFIYGWGPIPAFGLTGAAMATTIGRGIGVCFQLYILFGGRSRIKLGIGGWRFNWEILKRLGKIASSGAMQYVIASASWIFMMRIVAKFGSEVVAGYTIAIRLILFSVLPAWGLSNATATLVGQNLGAKKPDRAIRSVKMAAIITSIYIAIVSVFYLLFAEPLLSFFDDSEVVLEAGITTIFIFTYGYVLYGLGMIFSQAFNGAGDTRTPMFINIISFWMIEIPLGYYFAVELGFEVAGVCWAVISAEVVMAALALYFFYKGNWLKTEI